MHILIAGGIGIGKSGLIIELLRRVRKPVYGFRTEKVNAGGSGCARIYIHPAAGEKSYTDANTIGLPAPENAGSNAEVKAEANLEVFDGLGVKLLSGIPVGSIVLMDELGFLESGASAFCSKVLDILGGSYYAIAAVKEKSTPFLESVLSHQNALTFRMTPDNRDALYDQILNSLRAHDPSSPFL